MARIETHGLRRSVGLGGLFATAYGNVGSSIYYALGLVAAYAVGLTPVIFMLAGGLFALTAKTYAEGAAMLPEAGGSSSFARHAFNELVSFFAGWALSLDYILTIAISAFFVPHYLGAFWPALTHPPGRRDRRADRDRRARVAEHSRDRRVGEAQLLPRDRRSRDADPDHHPRGVPGARSRRCSCTRSTSARVPSYKHLIFALSLSMLAYTGIETVSNMAEEARDPGRDVPKAVNLILFAVIGVYAGMTVVALSALPVTGHGSHASTLLGPAAAARLPERSGARDHRSPRAGSADCARPPLLRGHPRGDDPLHRHQRRADRDLAAVVVARRAPAAPRIFARLHPKYRTPWFTIVVFSVFAGILLIPGQTDFLGNLYSFGAMLSFTTAHAAVIALRIKEPDRERPYRMPWNVRFRGSARSQ